MGENTKKMCIANKENTEKIEKVVEKWEKKLKKRGVKI